MSPHTTDTGRCYLCGAHGRSLLIEVAGTKIVRCEQCGLAGTLDVTDEPSYNEAYLHCERAGVEPSPAEIERSVRVERRRMARVRRAAPGRRLLEIGVGHGYFLEAARRGGFDVRGMDISSAAADFCRRHFGLRVEVSSLEDATYPAEALDVVAAWHVLEHLADPLNALSKIRGWLAPGGIIAVEVPNYESYDARVLGLAWHGWQPVYHRWHFAPMALEAMLRQAGFTILQIWRSPSSCARERLKRIPVLGVLRRILARRYPGTGVGAIARK
ncbi:MAG: class I SAM-dependent methyltransferase [Armatimonadota bacterium]|nr:MAG: class I SAM-dependent methyltransferase [Armatimonadota bacterium]